MNGVTNGNSQCKQVLFFDIDNCLYPKSARVHDLMADRINAYFEQHLNLAREEAVRLHSQYYQNYGLAIAGLIRHHKIDPLDFNAKVDDALPLEGVIRPRPGLKKMLADIDRSKVKLWLFTNAYVNHARRVVRLLGVEEFFDGVTYCDYASEPFVCKPDRDMYTKAMREAGVERCKDCFFVDDSYSNCKAAQELGWTAAHLVEDSACVPRVVASKHQINHIEELRSTFPQFFRMCEKV
ncbi:pyrimidine 5-nucleotidase [Cryphonectria parasitica EP155]|uniref:Pyrimidine 5-nucleotidase n=1 Tax=Cryphonectria parasitica (strain ATCC 38755 / EP155) TaxID=660469 RepID=A0A9P4XUW3_CRYP1|nr:pyrimidine 5-nucleotidase [Cryphonectria parasitica EP155]KAF3761348.1 pyrimidine 5-nucleotidase [Cryphonectria parasitica EP155]